MSVVVAIKDSKGKVLIGADSQGTTNYAKMTLSNKNNFKVFRPENTKNLVVGFCGSLRDMNLLHCMDRFVDELTVLKDSLDFKYVVTKIVPRLYKLMNDNDRLTDGKKNILGFQLLIAYKDLIFEIMPDGAVIQHNEHAVIGSGTLYAKGNIFNSTKSTKEKLVDAIKASCENDPYVYYPIVIMNTKDDKTEIISKEGE